MTSISRARLAWSGEGHAFRAGRPDGPEIVLDGDGAAGPSPTDALLLSLASCVGIDILHILDRSRVPVTELEVDVEGERAEEPPRRFEAVRAVFTVTGPEPEDEAKLERALALSEGTYCSVLHSLRPDIDVDLSVRRG